MLSSQTVPHRTLTDSMLHYEPISSVQLNWAVLAGVMVICIGIALPIGEALYGHFLRVQTSQNIPLLAIPDTAPEVAPQAMMANLRNLFGPTVLLGVVTTTIIAASRFENKRHITLPTLRKIHTSLEEENKKYRSFK